MSRLEGLLEQTVEGSGQFALLTGEAGIGKTRLLKEVSSAAETMGIEVITGHSREISGAPPYTPWINTLSTLLGADAPELKSMRASGHTTGSTAGFEAAQFQLFESISTKLRDISKSRALLIILENIHWADDATIQLLKFLAFDIGSVPIAIFVTSRGPKSDATDPTTALIGAIANDPNFTNIPLSPLRRESIAGLVQSAIAHSPPPTSLVDAVFDQSQGNALFATEAIKLLANNGQLDEGTLTNTTNWKIGIPAQINGLLANRFSQLTSETVDLLKIAAVIGRDFTATLLASVADKPAPKVLESITDAINAGLIVEDHSKGHELRFAHALFRQVLLEQCLMNQRIELHAAIAQAIEIGPDGKSPGTAGTLAYHYLEAIPLVGAEPAIKYSIRSGNHALKAGAYENAEQWFSRALDLLSNRVQSEAWAEASAGMARSLQFISTGSYRDAIGPHLKNAWEYYVANEMIDAAIELAAIPLSGGEKSKLIHVKLVDQTIKYADKSSVVYGYLLNNLARGMLFSFGDFTAADNHLRDALQISYSQADHNLRASTIRSIVELRHFHGAKTEDDFGLLEQAMESARAANNPGVEADCARAAIYSALQRGDLTVAIQIGKRAVSAAERSRQRNSLVYNLAGLGAAYEAAADWEGFFTVADRGLALDPENSSVLSEMIRAQEWTGQTQKVEENLARLSELSNKHSEHFDRVNYAMALLFSSHRNPDRIPEVISLASREVERKDVPRRVTIQAMMTIGMAGYESNSPELVKRAVDYFDANPETIIGDPVIEIFHARIRTLLGHLDESIEVIDRHYKQFSFAKFASHTAFFGVWLADALVRRGTTEDLNRGSRLLDKSEQLVREHRMFGITQRIQATRKRINDAFERSSRSDRLTKREIEILGLVASGRSNPEIASELFISRHTVVSHLKNIFEKIDVENRTQATAYAVENDMGS